MTTSFIIANIMSHWWQLLLYIFGIFTLAIAVTQAVLATLSYFFTACLDVLASIRDGEAGYWFAHVANIAIWWYILPGMKKGRNETPSRMTPLPREQSTPSRMTPLPTEQSYCAVDAAADSDCSRLPKLSPRRSPRLARVKYSD